MVLRLLGEDRPNTVEENRRIWDEEYPWTEHGDEWRAQAVLSGTDYEDWKQALIETFIRPHVTRDRVALEIAPGHGRWSEAIVPHAGRTILVDLSPRCIEYCRRRFAAHDTVSYHVTRGSDLPAAETGRVDFVFSYDAFVHMDRPVIEGYLGEIARVLKPGGTAIVHHAARRHATLGLGFLLGWGRPARKLYQLVSLRQKQGGDGWKSNVSCRLFARLAARHGLHVLGQVDRWGPDGRYSIFDMAITEMVAPGRSSGSSSPAGESPGRVGYARGGQADGRRTAPASGRSSSESGVG